MGQKVIVVYNFGLQTNKFDSHCCTRKRLMINFTFHLWFSRYERVLAIHHKELGVMIFFIIV
jgi:hypothetical protein